MSEASGISRKWYGKVSDIPQKNAWVVFNN